MTTGRQAFLLINGFPYTFPESFIVSENYGISSSIQLPTASNYPPIITPGFRVATISLEIPTGGWKNKLAYKTARQVIRVTQFLFCQRENYLNENGNVISTQENSTQEKGSKLKIPFTNLQVPWEIQVSCAYIGINVQLACCILSGFSVDSNPRSTNLENWTITLTEYDVSQIRGKPKDIIKNAPKTEGPGTFINVQFS